MHLFFKLKITDYKGWAHGAEEKRDMLLTLAMHIV